MKTKIYALLPLLLFLTLSTTYARIWRVNNISNFNGTTVYGENMGGSANNPVFAEINDAISWTPVKDGDTLHLEGSSRSYKAAEVTKRLVIIGPGYFLTDNPKTSINNLSANIGSITFSAGSDGSQLIGMNVISEFPFNITLNANNLAVKRCRIENSLEIGSGVANINIYQNFFTRNNDNALELNFPFVKATDVVFNNNICLKRLIWDGTLQQCNNNIFDGPPNILSLQFLTGEFRNNMLLPLNATVNINNGTHQNVTNNIGTNEEQFGTSNGNIVVINTSTIFIDQAGQSADGRYQIKPASVATNAGSDGTDIGAFGGIAPTNRYALSGLPPIPVTYNFISTGVTTPSGNINVTIDARTIK